MVTDKIGGEGLATTVTGSALECSPIAFPIAETDHTS